jgi:hypothetical protein
MQADLIIEKVFLSASIGYLDGFKKDVMYSNKNDNQIVSLSCNVNLYMTGVHYETFLGTLHCQ